MLLCVTLILDKIRCRGFYWKNKLQAVSSYLAVGHFVTFKVVEVAFSYNDKHVVVVV